MNIVEKCDIERIVGGKARLPPLKTRQASLTATKAMFSFLFLIPKLFNLFHEH